MKESLRVKLKDVRKRTHGLDAEKDGGAGPSKAKPNEVAEDTTEEGSCEYVPTPPSEFERLLTGTALYQWKTLLRWNFPGVGVSQKEPRRPRWLQKISLREA